MCVIYVVYYRQYLQGILLLVVSALDTVGFMSQFPPSVCVCFKLLAETSALEGGEGA